MQATIMHLVQDRFKEAQIDGSDTTMGRRVIIDMSNIDFMDLSGCKLLYHLRNDLRKVGGISLVLAHPRGSVRDIISRADENCSADKKLLSTCTFHSLPLAVE